MVVLRYFNALRTLNADTSDTDRMRFDTVNTGFTLTSDDEDTIRQQLEVIHVALRTHWRIHPYPSHLLHP